MRASLYQRSSNGLLSYPENTVRCLMWETMIGHPVDIASSVQSVEFQFRWKGPGLYNVKKGFHLSFDLPSLPLRWISDYSLLWNALSWSFWRLYFPQDWDSNKILLSTHVSYTRILVTIDRSLLHQTCFSSFPKTAAALLLRVDSSLRATILQVPLHSQSFRELWYILYPTHSAPIFYSWNKKFMAQKQNRLGP